MTDAELTAIEAGAGADIASKVRMLVRALFAARADRDRFQHQRDEIDEARALAEKEAQQLRAELDQARADLKASDGEVLRVSDENSFLRQQLADIDALGNEALDDAEEEHDVMVALHEALQQRVAPPPTAEFHVLADGSPEQMVDFIRRMTPPGARPSVIWHIPKGTIHAQQISTAAPADGSRGAQPEVREKGEGANQGREGVRRGGPGNRRVPGEEDAEAVSRWPDPTQEMLKGDATFEAIWQCIKSWDINVPHVYAGYCGATGNHVRAILDAIRGPAAGVDRLAQRALQELP